MKTKRSSRVLRILDLVADQTVTSSPFTLEGRAPPGLAAPEAIIRGSND